MCVFWKLGRSGDDGQRKFLAKNFRVPKNLYREDFVKYRLGSPRVLEDDRG
jgi:hypothetical protein